MRKKKSSIYKCARCSHAFSSIITLKRHSKKHLETLKELKLLKRGHVPEESKIGEVFRGKNKIIIS